MVTKRIYDDLAIQAFMASTIHQILNYNIISNPPYKLSTLYEMAHHFFEGAAMEEDHVKPSITNPINRLDSPI